MNYLNHFLFCVFVSQKNKTKFFKQWHVLLLHAFVNNGASCERRNVYMYINVYGYIDRWIDWLIGWPVSWLVGQSVRWSVSWLVGWSISWLVGRLVGWLVACSVGQSVSWSVSRSISRSVRYSVSQSVETDGGQNEGEAGSEGGWKIGRYAAR